MVFVGWGAHRLPSKLAKSWTTSGCLLSLFQEQEQVRVSGDESGSQASTALGDPARTVKAAGKERGWGHTEENGEEGGRKEEGDES